MPCVMSTLCVDVTPSAVHVGNIVQGARMAWAQGRDIGAIDEESDQARKVKQQAYIVLYVTPNPCLLN